MENLQKIEIDKNDQVNGFYTLLTNGSVVCLPDNKYFVPEYVLSVLLKRGIKFKMEEEKQNITDGDKIKSSVPNTSEV